MTTVRQALLANALDRGLRRSTMLSYERLLSRMGIIDWDISDATREAVSEALWNIDNPNTRRAATIAARSILGLPLRIPKGVPRRYDLPDEDTLRLALMTSPHEARGLLMMYAGLRIGEACAVTARDLDGDRLTIDKQVQQLHKTGEPTTTKVGPVKSSVGVVVIPDHLGRVVATLDTIAHPDRVRESLRRAGKKVGVPLNPHLLRHWYATTLLSRGAPLALVSRQMRHSDVATTLRAYQQYADEDVKRYL